MQTRSLAIRSLLMLVAFALSAAPAVGPECDCWCGQRRDWRRDAGVTVEAASPALIERTRSATTERSGPVQDRGPEAGVYTVTFTLVGFNTVKRDGIELPTNFTAHSTRN